MDRQLACPPFRPVAVPMPVPPATITHRSWTRLLTVDRKLPEDIVALLWRSPRELATMGEPLRQVGARCTVKLSWHDQTYVLKHYVEPTLRHSLKQNVSRSRACTTWLTAHKLADAGISTPRPVAFVENRLGPFRGDSYLLYPYVVGETLQSYLKNDENQQSLLTGIREQLVAFWSRLRQMRVSLADTNLKNFIVGDLQRLWVIDVDKVRFHRLTYAAARQHQRGWQQLTRSAHKTGNAATHLISEMAKQL